MFIYFLVKPLCSRNKKVTSSELGLMHKWDYCYESVRAVLSIVDVSETCLSM